MKRDTRRAILDMAKTLFSQQGYKRSPLGRLPVPWGSARAM